MTESPDSPRRLGRPYGATGFPTLMFRSAVPILLLVSLSGSLSGQNLGWTAVKSSVRAAYPEVKHLTVSRLSEEIRGTRTSLLLLDARSPEEFAVSHLEGAIRIDPDAGEFPLLASVPADQPIVVYCSVGYRSARVASELERQGWVNVRNLEGSIFEWANMGLPLHKGKTRVEVVHPYNRLWGRLLDPERRAELP